MKVRIAYLTLLVALLLLAAPTTRAAAPDSGGTCSPWSALQGDCDLQHLVASLVRAVLGPDAFQGASTSDPDGTTELGPGMNPDGSTELGPGMDRHGGTTMTTSTAAEPDGSTELRPGMDPAG